MQRDFQTVDASEMLEIAFRRFQSCQCHTLPVLHHAKLVGLVTMDNVGEFVAIQAAIEIARPRVG
jgi:CBS-domain-containing membrane protein